MIIDIRRELVGDAYTKYATLMDLYFAHHKTFHHLRELVHDDDLFDNVTYGFEYEGFDFLEELSQRTELCIRKLISEDWKRIDSNINSKECILWAERQNIRYVAVYNPLEYNHYHLFLRNDDEYNYNMYKAKFLGDFSGGLFLLRNGWIQQEARTVGHTEWAKKELGDDFLHNSWNHIYYFRPEAAMAFKLRWT